MNTQERKQDAIDTLQKLLTPGQLERILGGYMTHEIITDAEWAALSAESRARINDMMLHFSALLAQLVPAESQMVRLALLVEGAVGGKAASTDLVNECLSNAALIKHMREQCLTNGLWSCRSSDTKRVKLHSIYDHR